MMNKPLSSKYAPGVLYQMFNEFPVRSTFFFNVIDLNVESPETLNDDNNVVLFKKSTKSRNI